MMRVGDRDPLWTWFWMNQGMTIPFLQNGELLSWSIKISLNVLNPLKSISWIPPWGPDFTSLPVCREINPVVLAAAKGTPHRPLRMTRRVEVPKPSDPFLSIERIITLAPLKKLHPLRCHSRLEAESLISTSLSH
jgi:hypothetical protein